VASAHNTGAKPWGKGQKQLSARAGGWWAEPQQGVFLHVLSFLLTAFWLTLAAPVRAREGPLPVPPARNRAGEEAGSAETAGAAREGLAGQIESALAKGDLTAAQRLVPSLLRQPGVPADALLQTGVTLAQHDLYSEAAEVFGRCVKDYPQVFEGYYNLALAELALGRYSAALATLKRAPHASAPEEVPRSYLRGKIELALQQDTEAERDLSAAFAAAPPREPVGIAQSDLPGGIRNFPFLQRYSATSER
jgi:tetratricopeptide (TPR) repeat protein